MGSDQKDPKSHFGVVGQGNTDPQIVNITVPPNGEVTVRIEADKQFAGCPKQPHIIFQLSYKQDKEVKGKIPAQLVADGDF